MSKSDNKGFIKGGLIGVALGAVAGILFAPKSGKETRKDIKEAAVKANSEAEKRLKQVHTEIRVRSDEAMKHAAKLTGKAKQEVEDLQARAEIVRTKISETIAAVRDFEAEDQDVESTIAEGEKLIEQLKKKITPKS